MESKIIDEQTLSVLKLFQKTEITEHQVYLNLAKRMTGKNAEILRKIADDELRHYNKWKEYTKIGLKPYGFKVFLYLLVARILGLTFAIKMMEKGEEKAEMNYAYIEKKISEVSEVIEEEMEHEKILINMINEEKIAYIGSMVLGLNDALVELTGTLAGLTLALQNTKVIGLAGLITGIAATLSMSASEYLSQKSEEEGKDPLRAAFYTGFAYIIAVILLVIPYFILNDYFIALAVTLLIAILIILLFSQFVAIVKDMSFKKFFLEMVSISLGVATISFIIGWIARILLKIDAY